MIDDQINMNNLGISHTNNSRNVNDLNSNIININKNINNITNILNLLLKDLNLDNDVAISNLQNDISNSYNYFHNVLNY